MINLSHEQDNKDLIKYYEGYYIWYNKLYITNKKSSRDFKIFKSNCLYSR